MPTTNPELQAVIRSVRPALATAQPDESQRADFPAADDRPAKN